MRRFYFLTVFLLSVVNTVAAQLKSEVNECFELTSIVFRLAGAPEYVNYDILSYANDIDRCFKKYDNHKLIHYVKSLREDFFCKILQRKYGRVVEDSSKVKKAGFSNKNN